MLYTVLGATGYTGRRIAESLLAAGHRVRAVGRSAERLAPLAALGAEPWPGQADDADFARRVLEGVDAAYVMVPPVDPRDPGYRVQRQERISVVLAEAVRASGVTHVVNLSSMGAGRPGMLQVEALGRHEERLRAVPGLNAVHLQPAFFMENLLDQAAMAAAYGVVAYGLRPDAPVPMVAAADIAGAAAALLKSRAFRGQTAVELPGPRDVTMAEATRVLGEAVGLPDLAYLEMSRAQMVSAMERGGASREVIDVALDANDHLNRGTYTPAQPRNAAVCRTGIEAFAATSFAEAYRRAVAAQRVPAGV